jgi:hypothetical protein
MTTRRGTHGWPASRSRLLLLAFAVVAAFAASAAAETRSAKVNGMRLEVTSQPSQPATGTKTVYAVRVTDAAGKPLTGLKLTLLGRMADGMSVLAPLRATGEPGLYRGEVLFTMEGPWEVTVRVIGPGKPVEVPFTEQVVR